MEIQMGTDNNWTVEQPLRWWQRRSTRIVRTSKHSKAKQLPKHYKAKVRKKRKARKLARRRNK